MNDNELKVREKYEKQGWKVLRGGAPDFLCLKVEDGKIVGVLFIEVKYGRDRLSYEQAVYKKAIKFLRAKYKIEYLPNLKSHQPTLCKPIPHLTIPSHSRPVPTTQVHTRPIFSTFCKPSPNPSRLNQSILPFSAPTLAQIRHSTHT